MNAELLLKHFERISDTPEAVPRLREFVLDVAVRGRIVNQDASEESGGQLLARITKQRDELVRSGATSGIKVASPAIADDLGFTLKPGWVPVKLGQILIELQTGPFGSSLHQSDYVKGGVPVVNPASIQEGRIVPIDSMAVGEETLERLSTFKLRTRDIVMGRRGEMGRCAVVTERESGWLCGTGSLVLRLPEGLHPPYVAMLIGAPTSRRYLGSSAVGATMQNLNQSIHLNMPLGLPPFEEQRRIVDRVALVMGLCDEIIQALDAVQHNRERLFESILHRALEASDLVIAT
jgi:type I restriction enzyme S subunit